MSSRARGGTLILGGGFAGSWVARLLGKRGVETTIVCPENFMLFTPLLPEAASGTLEPRHVVVPLRMMCPRSELLLGRATALDQERRARDGRDAGRIARGRVRAARHRSRRGQSGAAHPRSRRARARLQGSRRRDRASQPRPAPAGAGGRGPGRRRCTPPSDVRLRRRRLRGRGGSRGALRSRTRRPPLLPAPARDHAQVDARGRSAVDPAGDPDEARRVRRAGADRAAEWRSASARRSKLSTRTARRCPAASASRRTRSSGRRASARTRCSRSSACRWTTGVACASIASSASRAATARGRSATALACRTKRRRNACDPPTSQHALRQARALARNLSGSPRPYRYRMLGQVATLGRYQGHRRRARAAHPRLPGLVRDADVSPEPAAAVLAQAPRRVDWTVALFFRRDIAELGTLGHPRRLE